MPVVPKFSEQALPHDIKLLFAQARSGKIDPPSFLEALDQRQIEPFIQLLYTGKAFDLTLTQVKELDVRRGRGLTDEVAKQLIDALEDIERSQDRQENR